MPAYVQCSALKSETTREVQKRFIRGVVSVLAPAMWWFDGPPMAEFIDKTPRASEMGFDLWLRPDGDGTLRYKSQHVKLSFLAQLPAAVPKGLTVNAAFQGNCRGRRLRLCLQARPHKRRLTTDFEVLASDRWAHRRDERFFSTNIEARPIDLHVFFQCFF